jgi:sodium-dependent phosphate transporter
VLVKGAASFKLEEKLGVGILIVISFGVGLFFGVLWVFVFGPCAKRQIEAKMASNESAAMEKKADVEASTSTPPAAENEEEDFDSFEKFIVGEAPVPEPSTKIVTAQPVVTLEPAATEISTSWFKKLKDNTVDQDLYTQSMHESAKAESIWDNEEQFDEGAENLFNYIQVFTASMNSFAHGANDVANTIAPMSAVIDIYMTGEVGSKTGVPKWMLAFGGFAIVVGLLLYGYRVMKSLGYKLTMLSPSRGTSAELGASLTSVTASFMGIPVSTTQCIVGAVTAVGLVGGRQAVDWIFFVKICASWVGLFFVAVVFSAGLFSFCYYSPGKIYPAYLIDVVDEE